jgi:hypothetical protein
MKICAPTDGFEGSQAVSARHSGKSSYTELKALGSVRTILQLDTNSYFKLLFLLN